MKEEIRFRSVADAAKYLTEQKGIDPYCARDSIYKIIRFRPVGITHGYIIRKDSETKEIILREKE